MANVAWTWMSMAAQRWLRGLSQLQIAAFTVGAGAICLLLLLPVLAATNLVKMHIEFSVDALGMNVFAGILPSPSAIFFGTTALAELGS